MTIHIRYADLAIYAAHCGFWGAFVTARLASRQKGRTESDDPVSQKKRTAKYSRLLVVVHCAAFAVMYSGIAAAVFFERVPIWFAGQRLAGAVIIGVGAALAASVVLYFRSWRFRAAVSEGHQLATGGPFAVLRHPIYMGFNLLALGSAFWIPSPVVWTGFVLMLVGSDLRGRAEENLLTETFGTDYLAYREKTWRFIPRVY